MGCQLFWILVVFVVLSALGRVISNNARDEISRAIGYWATFVARVVMCCIVFGAMVTVGHARDRDGRFAQSPLHGWFESLHSGQGPCCSDADGTAISDVDWDTKDGHYRVRMDVSSSAPVIDMQWIDVPDDAVITEPNRAGRAMVWPVRLSPGGGPVKIKIRCFMPGAGG